MPVISGGLVIEGAVPRSGSVSAESTAGRPAVSGALKWARANYSFAVDAGAVGTIALTGATIIPSGAIVLGGFIEVTTAVASATGTVALQVEAAGDILATVGQAGLTAGRKSVIPAFTGAASVKTTAARDISMVIATAVLTAGVFSVNLAYVETV